MRVRNEIVAAATFVVALAFLMNQTPQMSGSPSFSLVTNDSSEGAVAAVDISSPDVSAVISGGPVGAIILTSEYLRRPDRERAADYSSFSTPTKSDLVSRRDQIMIMADILTLASQPVSRTRFLKRLNLSQYQLKRYLRFLIQKRLLLEEFGQTRTYRITERGSAFLKLIED